MELYEVVMKLTGPVKAVGESREDERRLRNLVALTKLTDQLLHEIADAAKDHSRVEASMRAIGGFANNFLRGVRNP